MPGHALYRSFETEQQAVDYIALFLIDVVGWELVEDIEDTATVRDMTFSSTGELEVPNGFKRYIRLRAESNAIQLYTYETYNSSVDNTGEVTEATYGKITTEGDAQGFEATVIADKERVVLFFRTYDDNAQYLGYVGRIKSYYNVYQNRYPNMVKGCQNAAYNWYYSAAERNALKFYASVRLDIRTEA